MYTLMYTLYDHSHLIAVTPITEVLISVTPYLSAIEQGSRVRMECKANGGANVYYEWKKIDRLSFVMSSLDGDRNADNVLT